MPQLYMSNIPFQYLTQYCWNNSSITYKHSFLRYLEEFSILILYINFFSLSILLYLICYNMKSYTKVNSFTNSPSSTQIISYIINIL